jgi:hypothetical protein
MIVLGISVLILIILYYWFFIRLHDWTGDWIDAKKDVFKIIILNYKSVTVNGIMETISGNTIYMNGQIGKLSGDNINWSGGYVWTRIKVSIPEVKQVEKIIQVQTQMQENLDKKWLNIWGDPKTGTYIKIEKLNDQIIMTNSVLPGKEVIIIKDDSVITSDGVSCLKMQGVNLVNISGTILVPVTSWVDYNNPIFYYGDWINLKDNSKNFIGPFIGKKGFVEVKIRYHEIFEGEVSGETIKVKDMVGTVNGSEIKWSNGDIWVKK